MEEYWEEKKWRLWVVLQVPVKRKKKKEKLNVIFYSAFKYFLTQEIKIKCNIKEKKPCNKNNKKKQQ